MTKAEEILERHLVGYDTVSYTDEDHKLKQCFLNAINEALTTHSVSKSFYCLDKNTQEGACKYQCDECIDLDDNI
jgi:hypothetical protein